jgi:polysaccharide export outer membrane protein
MTFPAPPRLAAATLLLCAACAACSAFSGCHRKYFRPGSLPIQYSAVTAQDARRVDLSRLARSSLPGDVIYPGDVIDVTLATGYEEQASQQWPLRVSDSGEVDLPLVGPVRVAGLPVTDAEQAIRRQSIVQRVYRDPHVSVLLKDRKTNRVTVIGAVQEPGTHSLPAYNSDLLSALIAAGGLTDQASTIVEIRNLADTPTRFASYGGSRETVRKTESVQIDLITASGGIGPDYRITDGSVIMVREQDPKTIQVIGLVRKPNQFEIPAGQDVRLLDAIAMAGGRSLQIADRVHVIRNLEGVDRPVVVRVSVREAKQGGPANLLLAAGDVISVEETPLTFTVGTIQSFVRFGFTSALPGF